jgi:hypothetical protein
MEVFYGFLLLLRTNRKRIHTTNIIISFKAEFGGGGGLLVRQVVKEEEGLAVAVAHDVK